MPGAAPAICGVTALASLDELQPFVGAWERLARDSQTATPFQLPAWLIPWWRHFVRGRLCVLAFFNKDRIGGDPSGQFCLHLGNSARESLLWRATSLCPAGDKNLSLIEVR